MSVAMESRCTAASLFTSIIGNDSVQVARCRALRRDDDLPNDPRLIQGVSMIPMQRHVQTLG